VTGSGEVIDVTKFGGNWNYYQPTITTATTSIAPSVVWQNTTSNATYCSAASALTN
jgi:hypothetical protein